MIHKGPNCRRLVRQVSPPKESMIENTYENAIYFDHDHGVRFWQNMIHWDGGVKPHDYFNHNRVNKDDSFHNGLDRNIEY